MFDLFPHTVTIFNVSSEADEFEPTTTYDDGTASIAFVQQMVPGTSEVVINRDTRITAFRIFLPPTASVSGTSRIRWGSRLMEVDGEPATVYTPAGAHHVEVDAKEYLG